MNNSLIGIAGVHYVVSELSRRGMVALPTVKNTAAYDIVALNVQGTRHANIQVKASSKRVRFFPMPPIEKIRTGARDFYVLVRWIESEKKYEGFLLRGRQARLAVQEDCRLQGINIKLGTRKKEFPCIAVERGRAKTKDARRWAREWLKWQW
jgi:hypothetical protein